jgi:CHAD domain-containing protein
MRVGTRRLRATLRVFADVMDSQWAVELESELRWLAHLLGAVRDLDVLRSRLGDSLNAENAEERAALRNVEQTLILRHRDAKAAMLEGLKSERYQVLLERLSAGALAPQLTLEAGASAQVALLPRLDRAWKKLSRAAEKLKRSDPAPEYHRVRKMGKRIRYVAELLSSDLSPKNRERALRFIGAMKKMQDTLGELQDADVASKTLRLMSEIVVKHPEALRKLIQTQVKLEEKARRKYPKIWQVARGLGNKKWMLVPANNTQTTSA